MLEVTRSLARRRSRWFGGADDAYRAEPRSEDVIRHCFEQHGEISGVEAEAINRHLVALDGAPLNVWCAGGVLNDQVIDLMVARDFEQCRGRARAFAGDAWSHVDDRIYDAAAIRVRRW